MVRRYAFATSPCSTPPWIFSSAPRGRPSRTRRYGCPPLLVISSVAVTRNRSTCPLCGRAQNEGVTRADAEAAGRSSARALVRTYVRGMALAHVVQSTLQQQRNGGHRASEVSEVCLPLYLPTSITTTTTTPTTCSSTNTTTYTISTTAASAAATTTSTY